jgi:hypothetical protein
MKIVFNENALSLRGTAICLFDLAFYNQTILGNESIIIYDTTHPANNNLVIEKFSKQFSVYGYTDFSIADEHIKSAGCDAAFFIKHGRNDGRYSKYVKNLIMAVGICDASDSHGDVYAFCSKWLADTCNIGVDYVPHMINLPDVDKDLREQLGIPSTATVFGRTGGWETFDIPFVKEAIKDILNSRDDIYFVFQYTEPFYSHPRIIYLDASADMVFKVKLINTYDAFLHGRKVGESFGIAVFEASSKNKRVITYFDSPERNHIEVLGDKGLYYRNKDEFITIINNFDRNIEGDFNCAKDFTPEKVMQKFKDIYLK